MTTPQSEDAPLTVFNLFLKTARAILKEADQRLEKMAGLSASTYIVLMALKMNRGTMTGSVLAQLTGTEPHNITKLAERMTRDGLVTTQRSDPDRRFVHIRITDAGRAALQKGTPAAHELVARTMGSIRKADLATLERILADLAQATRNGST